MLKPFVPHGIGWIAYNPIKMFLTIKEVLLLSNLKPFLLDIAWKKIVERAIPTTWIQYSLSVSQRTHVNHELSHRGWSKNEVMLGFLLRIRYCVHFFWNVLLRVQSQIDKFLKICTVC
eukprot:Lithocolla_globosa_v1_NODE_3842_length_1558_cov_16.637326.p3 type:complete len:118 gc:universal NODE_3842_length_1558_cov_16.637326:402-49(-)